MRGALVLLAFLAAACGANERAAPPERPATAAVASAPAPAAHADVDVDWVDPEPPDAQARAEQVLDAVWNRDKKTALEMRITTLVDRTTGIEGFASALAAREVSVDERLGRLGARVTEQEIVISLPGSVLFDFDRAEIRADAERTLREVAEVLKAHRERPVRVEGHTDSIASDAYNRTLSEKRAKSVAAWLAAHGVTAARMTTAGRGEEQPVADNDTPAGRQKNRRVEIVIGKS
ncbi:MAG TPA: OmpA family protein [Thermoanaerobaculia bacterium]